MRLAFAISNALVVVYSIESLKLVPASISGRFRSAASIVSITFGTHRYGQLVVFLGSQIVIHLYTLVQRSFQPLLLGSPVLEPELHVLVLQLGKLTAVGQSVEALGVAEYLGLCRMRVLFVPFLQPWHLADRIDEGAIALVAAFVAGGRVSTAAATATAAAEGRVIASRRGDDRVNGVAAAGADAVVHRHVGQVRADTEERVRIGEHGVRN